MSSSDFGMAPDRSKWIEEKNAAVGDAHALAAHLISGLELSRCSDADRAAALMEAVRHVGRALTTLPKVPQSNATSVCLASLPSFYNWPDWLVGALAEWLARQFDKGFTRDLGKRLSEYDYKAFP